MLLDVEYRILLHLSACPHQTAAWADLLNAFADPKAYAVTEGVLYCLKQSGLVSFPDGGSKSAAVRITHMGLRAIREEQELRETAKHNADQDARRELQERKYQRCTAVLAALLSGLLGILGVIVGRCLLP